MSDPRPVLFVTTEIPPDRVGAFRALSGRVPVEFALFGGGLHATDGVTDHGLPAREVSQREIFGLASSGDYRAVVAGTVGRIALPAAWLGAERARVPFVLWTALWAHPRSAAHLPGALLLRLLYRRAAAVVTYGSHVSRFAEANGAPASRVTVAPQAVDQDFWVAGAGGGGATGYAAGDSAAANASPAAGPASAVAAPPRFLFVGRDDPGKGVDTLLAAWDASGLGADGRAELRLIGPPADRAAGRAGVSGLGSLAPEAVRDEMRAATAVVVPSERTATFREPWGLVVNEAMHSGALVIASNEVGAVAGRLVVDGRTGLVVGEKDVNGLSRSMTSVATAESPRYRGIAAAGQRAAVHLSQDRWAAAFADALDVSVASRP
ncbi:MAG: glycosyltransferase family 4 protein [Solirubrobacteraceae bacterium]|nr:glycosyltransferase family 4 protein [Solirubrobacteraceae bacterium]